MSHELSMPTNYVAPGAPVVLRPLSSLHVAFGHLLQGRDTDRYVAALRSLGLPVKDPVDVFALEFEALDEALARESDREAKRVAAVKAERRAYAAQFEEVVAERAAQRKKFAREVLPKKRALGAKIVSAIRELDTDGYFAEQLAAIEVEADAGLPVSDFESTQERLALTALELEADPILAEDFEALKLQRDPRGWLPDVIGMVEATRDAKQRERAAEVARARRIIQLAGGL